MHTLGASGEKAPTHVHAWECHNATFTKRSMGQVATKPPPVNKGNTCMRHSRNSKTAHIVYHDWHCDSLNYNAPPIAPKSTTIQLERGPPLPTHMPASQRNSLLPIAHFMCRPDEIEHSTDLCCRICTFTVVPAAWHSASTT